MQWLETFLIRLCCRWFGRSMPKKDSWEQYYNTSYVRWGCVGSTTSKDHQQCWATRSILNVTTSHISFRSTTSSVVFIVISIISSTVLISFCKCYWRASDYYKKWSQRVLSYSEERKDNGVKPGVVPTLKWPNTRTTAHLFDESIIFVDEMRIWSSIFGLC